MNWRISPVANRKPQPTPCSARCSLTWDCQDCFVRLPDIFRDEEIQLQIQTADRDCHADGPAMGLALLLGVDGPC